MTLQKRLAFRGIWFLLPAVLLFLVLEYYPLVSSIFYSFTYWNGIGSPRFVGLDNYSWFFQDPRMKTALVNSFSMAAYGILVQNPAALLLAVLLNRPMMSRSYMRTVFYLPSVISLVVVGVVFKHILQYYGVLNTFLTHVGLDFLVTDWLGTVSTSFPTIIALTQWQAIGFCAIIYLAGLQSIPKEMLEAASIDGAVGFRRFIHVVFPMLMPAVTIVLFLTIFGALSLFDLPFIMTNGGPGHSSYTLFFSIYKSGFEESEYGYATAAGLLLGVWIIILTSIQVMLTRRRETEL